MRSEPTAGKTRGVSSSATQAWFVGFILMLRCKKFFFIRAGKTCSHQWTPSWQTPLPVKEHTACFYSCFTPRLVAGSWAKCQRKSVVKHLFSCSTNSNPQGNNSEFVLLQASNHRVRFTSISRVKNWSDGRSYAGERKRDLLSTRPKYCISFCHFPHTDKGADVLTRQTGTNYWPNLKVWVCLLASQTNKPVI